ncbi:hypothetical protein [Acidisoma sp. S159]|uniref:hypothetical protein n=1 Tax=Acidisoma sp. S159 TaxID=1747225 RepID=UPI00131DCB5A|nr:hypothetical protein [Acidisoma sp. S159]
MNDLQARIEGHAAEIAEEFLLSASNKSRKDRATLLQIAETAWQAAELDLIGKSPKPQHLARMTKLADKLEYRIYQLSKERLSSSRADASLRDAREWVTALLGAIRMGGSA